MAIIVPKKIKNKISSYSLCSFKNIIAEFRPLNKTARHNVCLSVSLAAEIFNLKLFPEVPEIFLHSSPLVNRIVAGPWQFKVFQGLPNCTKGKSQGFFWRTLIQRMEFFKKNATNRVKVNKKDCPF